MANSILQTIDSQLDQLFAGWNIYSTILVVILLAYLFSPLFFGAEADTHPMLLARQASTSPVRQSGESPVYRSLETPYGYPLRTGLNVKDEGAPKWAAGRDGDLRDIWREALRSRDASPLGGFSRIVTVRGKEGPVSHEFKAISKDVNIIGKYIQAQGAKRVAIYLPNSVEFFVGLLASAFYGFVPILIPQGLSIDLLSQILRETQPDILIAPAGILSQQELSKSAPALKHTIWVVEATSRHVKWSEEPKRGSKVSEWHEIIDQAKESTDDSLPSSEFPSGLPNVISTWLKKDGGGYELVEFTQKNIIAGVAAQLSALPRAHRLGDQDLVLSLESLTLLYPLTITLAALFSHASIAFTSVAGSTPDYDLAFQNIKPTVLIASAETMSKAHAQKTAANQGFFQKLHHSRHARSLAAGTMRKANSLANRLGPRIIYTSERAGTDSVPLSSFDLLDLRVLTGARIIYALTLPRVAGAVTQTNLLDYRTDSRGNRSHLGAPLSSVELKLVETPLVKIRDDSHGNHGGAIVVNGPAVVGGEVKTDIVGKPRDDHCLALE